MWSYVNTTRPQKYETVSNLSEYVNISSSWDYSVGNLEGIRIVEGLEARPLSQSEKPIMGDDGSITIPMGDEEFDVEQIEEWRLNALQNETTYSRLLKQKYAEKHAETHDTLREKKRQRVLTNRIPDALPHQESLPAPSNRTRFIKKGGESPRTPTEEKPKLKKKTYKRNWRIYNEGQYNEFRYFGLFASGLADMVTESNEYTTGRHKIPFHDMLVAALIVSHRGVSGRRAQGILEESQLMGYIKEIPAPTTLWKFMNSEELKFILHALVIISATPLSEAEMCMAIDSSGFRTSSYSDWFGEKHRYVKYNEWLKLHIIAGVSTHVIANAVVTPKNVGDNVEFMPLLDGVLKYFKVKKMVADKGYQARDNYTYCAKHDIQLFVPFKCNSTGKAKGSLAWSEAYAFAQSNPQEFAKEYHVRSNVETIFHQMKATQGETIRSKLVVTQTNELYLKVIVHNIRMLIQAFAESKSLPMFKPLLE